jgi:LmbE family N-acetylglucosaminyl deacetylase
MLALNIAARAGRPLEVLCIGAHCDDIEIGCGGTVLTLQRLHPACRIHWFVLTSNPERRDETHTAVAALVGSPNRGEVRVHDLPDGHLPAHFTQVKRHFEDMRRAVEPDLVLTHHGLDRHQDHALVSQVTWQTFRDHMVWEYEIPKFDGDLATPSLYVPLGGDIASRKTDIVVSSFPSQIDKPWFKADNLLALMRLRGLESRAASGFAEGFHCRKLTFGEAVHP